MLTRITLALAMCISTAQAQEMRQFLAETSTPLAEIAANLAPVLPDNVAFTATPQNAYVTYSGTHTPASLAAFLGSAFEALDPGAIAPGQTVSLSLVLTGHSDRTDLALMVLGRFEQHADLLAGGQVMMDGRGADPCSGQVIVQHELPPEDTMRGYLSALETAGFVFEDTDDADTSFFFGQGPDCAVALYVEGEAGGSTAIVRYLEE